MSPMITGKKQVTPAKRVQALQLPIFREIAALALERKAINLAGGTPDFPAPLDIKNAAITAIATDLNQYALSQGSPALRNSIAKRFSQQHGVNFDPDSEITVCCGATEGMAATALAMIDPEDEVIILEPAFTIYAPDVILSGGKPVYVSLKPPDFRIVLADLEAAVSTKTKAIIFNNPHNPTGRVFDESEVAAIAQLCLKYNLLAITDEIYDELIFDGITIPRLWQYPGMQKNTIIINGFSKTYSVTGWRLGYVLASQALTKAIRVAHNYLTISAAAPLQQAAIEGMQASATYYQELRRSYQEKRDILYNGLRKLGIPAALPQGGYFLLADFSDFGWNDDVAFAKAMIEETGVAAVPLSGFYSQNPHTNRLLLRFAFCKQQDTLLSALLRLQSINKLKR